MTDIQTIFVICIFISTSKQCPTMTIEFFTKHYHAQAYPTVPLKRYHTKLTNMLPSHTRP